MTYYASWSGKCRDFPGLPGIVSPPIDTLPDQAALHAAHVGHLVDHFLEENEDKVCSGLSVTGSANPDGGSSLSLSISLAPAPAVPATPTDGVVDGGTPAQTPEQTVPVDQPAPVQSEAQPQEAGTAPSESAGTSDQGGSPSEQVPAEAATGAPAPAETAAPA